ncbi:hypothetical protein EDEG_01722 [Edhazardia aedis USNM 41457]|uniref:Uncharacterized protein n=1 Tax=Edhazardia aedis (strain USNM 41457) TaxID=1003232 RepID=J9D909_EDHAE|nr:hypothetical protein EDEG_01722 [Edhazardia aedis USNM 41457]|eukprot:EJW03989.1 hypothetical protein EDEG_01722 [Edhazardia aedis USNM 41457]
MNVNKPLSDDFLDNNREINHISTTRSFTKNYIDDTENQKLNVSKTDSDIDNNVKSNFTEKIHIIDYTNHYNPNIKHSNLLGNIKENECENINYDTDKEKSPESSDQKNQNSNFLSNPKEIQSNKHNKNSQQKNVSDQKKNEKDIYTNQYKNKKSDSTNENFIDTHEKKIQNNHEPIEFSISKGRTINENSFGEYPLSREIHNFPASRRENFSTIIKNMNKDNLNTAPAIEDNNYHHNTEKHNDLVTSEATNQFIHNNHNEISKKIPSEDYFTYKSSYSSELIHSNNYHTPEIETITIFSEKIPSDNLAIDQYNNKNDKINEYNNNNNNNNSTNNNNKNNEYNNKIMNTIIIIVLITIIMLIIMTMKIIYLKKNRLINLCSQKNNKDVNITLTLI